MGAADTCAHIVATLQYRTKKLNWFLGHVDSASTGGAGFNRMLDCDPEHTTLQEAVASRLVDGKLQLRAANIWIE
jgi:hypothetical protein